MTVKITVELPEELAERARAAAAQARRPFEDLLLEWIDRGASEPPIDSLADAEILALCDSQMRTDLQQELGELLSANREGSLTEPARSRLDELMRGYRQGP